MIAQEKGVKATVKVILSGEFLKVLKELLLSIQSIPARRSVKLFGGGGGGGGRAAVVSGFLKGTDGGSHRVGKYFADQFLNSARQTVPAGWVYSLEWLALRWALYYQLLSQSSLIRLSRSISGD